jgi:hypothetical protein
VRGSRPIRTSCLLHEGVVDALAGAGEEHLAEGDPADHKREEQQDEVGGEDPRAGTGQEAAP